MKMIKISAVGILLSVCGTLIHLIFKKKIKKSYDDGWFSGFTEAARDYDKEIRSMRSANGEMKEENESFKPV